ncbi:hypothetical protein OE88DRAFT_1632605 [Heliocybe sulcata]|uniref:Uncharacterized protein n=1 Tax=Heliocybe sulcata TaxID=5364 RepID=A0A5C3MXB0_9AGAM|nr:hypothetical protein OE88DRAFT_1632605 [Heliocybe sulcata]
MLGSADCEHSIYTLPDAFGLSRKYRYTPSRIPQEHNSVAQRFVPQAGSIAAKSSRSVEEIIHPYPNLSSWLYAHHYWTSSNSKSLADREQMQELLTSELFRADDIKGVDFRRLDKVLDETPLPWQDRNNGWIQSTITIDAIPDLPPDIDVEGIHFEIPGFWHRSITGVIRSVFGHDTVSHNFHLHPFERLCAKTDDESNAGIQRVFDELYTTQAWLDADAELQNSPQEPDCERPRAIAALMFASDSTHLAQFGQAKLWPAYMYFGNQSKYERCQPQSHAAHHVAYIPSLPDTIHDLLRDSRGGKIAAGSLAPLLAHCRRELFHGAWKLVLDEEFIAAYEHGIVVECVDGIERRIYPRIFIYSADYPEKVLIATLRDMGQCPCPRCLVRKDCLQDLGNVEDQAMRTESRRVDSNDRQYKVDQARTLIYGDGYVVNSERVEELLKSESLVPTKNAFSAVLAKFGFDIFPVLAVDLMHEFELGIWKAFFTHLIRILEANDINSINELNRRFRQVPTFGCSTIRRFSVDVAAMKKMAARDFEDILQASRISWCCIPCFEGLLPSPHNGVVLDLLYLLAEWHGLAKLRMHTDSSVKRLHELTTVVGADLRRFVTVTCPAFNTHETAKEYEARSRAEARRGANQGSSAVSSGSGGRRPRTLNLRRYKFHALGDYAFTIPILGTTDSYTTQTSEMEHKLVKRRYEQTNKNVTMTGQIVRLDIRACEMRRMAQELRELGISLPNDPKPMLKDTNQSEQEDDHGLDRFTIAAEERLRNAIYVGHWLQSYPDDPALEVSPGVHYIGPYQDRIHKHATISFNFTTYDICRDRDTINPSTDKCNILVALDWDGVPNQHRFGYAQVLGVYHVQIQGDFVTDKDKAARFDFLWVRWYEYAEEILAGTAPRRLECLRFIPQGQEDAFGFLDPASVIRGAHIIPAYQDGRTSELLGPSIARDTDGDYRYYYINRFVDRDMLMRYIGLGVGHVAGARCEPDNYQYVVDVDTNKDTDAENHGTTAEINIADATGEPEDDDDLEDGSEGENVEEEEIYDQYDSL